MLPVTDGACAQVLGKSPDILNVAALVVEPLYCMLHPLLKQTVHAVLRQHHIACWMSWLVFCVISPHLACPANSAASVITRLHVQPETLNREP